MALSSGNWILASLPKEEIEHLQPHLESVPVRLNEIIYSVGDPVRYCYFPENCVISLLIVMQNGETVEVCMIGREGLVGVLEILGAGRSSNLVLVQVPGNCWRIRRDTLYREFKRGGILHDRMLRYTRNVLAQISQTAACNRVHRLEQRFCRWLLIAHDRAQRDRFPMTHEFLSHILGTPRSEVTLAAGVLRKAGYIQYQRGQITILDRKGLESAACECYQILQHNLVLSG